MRVLVDFLAEKFTKMERSARDDRGEAQALVNGTRNEVPRRSSFVSSVENCASFAEVQRQTGVVLGNRA